MLLMCKYRFCRRMAGRAQPRWAGGSLQSGGAGGRAWRGDGRGVGRGWRERERGRGLRSGWVFYL
jgi:hypothetical protein